MSNNGTIKLWTKIGIVCSGMLALAGVMTITFKIASKPYYHLLTLIGEERQARYSADTLIVRQLGDIDRDVARIAEALQYPLTSPTRETILERVEPPPAHPERAVQKPRPTNPLKGR